MSPSPSSTRWCPTPEQLMILEELYKRGLRTPNASQIQKITAHLAYYGKIQGKNVFYWFQNHKARDRQKLRKKLHQQHLLQQHLRLNYQIDPHAQFAAAHVLPPLHDHHSFLAPPYAVKFQFSSLNSAPDLHALGAGVCEEASEKGALKQQQQQQMWRTDDNNLPKDCFMRSYGHDSGMITNVGPTFFPCRRATRTRPLETLELFPLLPPTATADHPKTTS